ncbi:hypothetical protein ACROYT_G040342 [Oculina patagonica]
MSGFAIIVGLLTILSVGHVHGQSLFIDEVSIKQAYEDVRSDNTPTTWALCTYATKNTIALLDTGSDYNEFLNYLTDDNRAYGYVRYETDNGTRFAFITWIGPGVSPLKKAGVSTDKAFMKEIFMQFAKEILADEKAELKYEVVQGILEAASGAMYGTGV